MPKIHSWGNDRLNGIVVWWYMISELNSRRANWGVYQIEYCGEWSPSSSWTQCKMVEAAWNWSFDEVRLRSTTLEAMGSMKVAHLPRSNIVEYLSRSRFHFLRGIYVVCWCVVLTMTVHYQKRMIILRILAIYRMIDVFPSPEEHFTWRMLSLSNKTNIDYLSDDTDQPKTSTSLSLSCIVWRRQTQLHIYYAPGSRCLCVCPRVCHVCALKLFAWLRRNFAKL